MFNIEKDSKGNYQIVEILSNQQLHMKFIKEKDGLYSININLYENRIKNLSKENKEDSPSISASILGMKMFKALEKKVLEDNNNKNIVIYCTWFNEKNKKVYYDFLSQYGYEYNKINNKDCIMKKY